MAQLQTITIASGSGDTVTQALTKLYADLAKAANNFIDTADPTSPTDGQSWYRSDEGKAYCQKPTTGKLEILWFYILNQDLDFAGFEAGEMHLEEFTTGTLPAAGAGEESRVVWNTTIGQPVAYTSGGRVAVPHFNLDATEHFPIECELGVAGAGQAATADTNTRFGGWLLDNVLDELNFRAKLTIPTGWTGANDLLLEVEFLLSAAETANDKVDMDGNWHTLSHTSGDDPSVAMTAMTTVNYDIGVTAIGQYDIHKLRLTVVYNAAGNTVAVGDTIAGYIIRNTVGGAGKVANIIVTRITLLVPVWRVAWA